MNSAGQIKQGCGVATSKIPFVSSRTLLLALSLVKLVICVVSGTAHYRKASWGDPWQPIGWLLHVLLVLRLPARPPWPGDRFQVPKKAEDSNFSILAPVLCSFPPLEFLTAPWNGDALFDESGNDLRYLKSHIIGHPYQAAWFHGIISRETLFHYYVWGFLKLFGFNILAYEAALFVIWLTTFVFTLLLVDLFFGSYFITSVTALIFNFFPFAFIYTFVGYRYPMTVALAVVSLYFLHLGFRATSRFYLALGGVAGGLCLASSIPGKQYLLTLVIAGLLSALFYWRSLKRSVTWTSLAIVVYELSSRCHANSLLHHLQVERLYLL